MTYLGYHHLARVTFCWHEEIRRSAECHILSPHWLIFTVTWGVHVHVCPGIRVLGKMFYPCSHPIKIRDNFIRILDWIWSDPGCSPLSYAASSVLSTALCRDENSSRDHEFIWTFSREAWDGARSELPRDSLMRNMRAQNYRNNEKGSDGLQRALYCSYRQNTK